LIGEPPVHPHERTWLSTPEMSMISAASAIRTVNHLVRCAGDMADPRPRPMSISVIRKTPNENSNLNVNKAWYGIGLILGRIANNTKFNAPVRTRTVMHV